ncbi:MAG: AlpA family phage regulatory protein [Caulobacter sp.]|nr:AlpA family phage regulatory protein [Caulobacter sp.]
MPDQVSTAAGQLVRPIRRAELRKLVPLADSTIYDLEQRGDFPRRFPLTRRCVVWDRAEVEAWLVERKTKPLPDEQLAPGPNVALRRTRPVRRA